jgi:hypothetical protein
MSPTIQLIQLTLRFEREAERQRRSLWHTEMILREKERSAILSSVPTPTSLNDTLRVRRRTDVKVPAFGDQGIVCN